MNVPNLSIADAFHHYRLRVLPPNATPHEVEACRRAFYAGAYFMFSYLITTVGAQDVPVDDGVSIMDRLSAECEAFDLWRRQS
jgi:hypothetical protein